jgi:hypothetical protein
MSGNHWIITEKLTILYKSMRRLRYVHYIKFTLIITIHHIPLSRYRNSNESILEALFRENGNLPPLLCIRICIHLAVPDPDPYWECSSGSGSRSLEIDPNSQINLVSSLSKRLLCLS